MDDEVKDPMEKEEEEVDEIGLGDDEDDADDDADDELNDEDEM